MNRRSDEDAASAVLVQGSLHAADGTPLGLRETTVDLPAGRSLVPLAFAGTLFHDRAAAGPYTLAHVLVRATRAHDSEQRSALAHRTAAYPLTAFDPAPADDPRKLDVARELDGYAARLAGER